MSKFIMKQVIVLVLLSIFTVNNAINRPVYKVSLSQKGYTQFLQYDIEIPPIREFTFCTWLRIFKFNADQSIFSYVVDGNTRIMRFWLRNGGNEIKFAVHDKILSEMPVNLTENIWHHICFSYQSFYGAWALYVDGQIEYCAASEMLKGYILPGGGSIVVGYGLNEEGTSVGFHGQLFGVNMILKSTIIRNHTIEMDPRFQQKLFRKNKIKNGIEDIEYIILNNLKKDDLYYFGKFQTTSTLHPPMANIKTRRFRKTPTITTENSSRESLIFDFNERNKIPTTDEAKIHIWNLINKAGQQGKFKQEKKGSEIFGSGTQDLPTLSVFETPPSLDPPSFNVYDTVFENEKPQVKPQPFSHSSDKLSLQEKPKILDISYIQPKSKSKDMMPFHKQLNGLVDIETPPPPQKNPEVYGQWTSSQFSNNVLDYLKNINFQYKKPSKPPHISLVPPTIPLLQNSDSFPYASNTYAYKVKPNKPFNFQRRSFVDSYFINPVKRDINGNKNVNVQILENDLRSNILKLHAETRPKYVEVTNRGNRKGFYRHYRNVDNSKEDSKEETRIIPFIEDPNISNHKLTAENDMYKMKKLVSILPFIKSLEYLIESNDSPKSSEWHNLKMYNEDQPRTITLESVEALNSKVNYGENMRVNQHNPISVIYNDQRGRLEKTIADGNLKADREMAKDVANKADLDQPVSIFKYNRGFLPGHKEKKNKKRLRTHLAHLNNTTNISNFNKSVKIGNALNELPVIGSSNQDKKKSFVGGDERIPDINQYRSDIDSYYSSKDVVPPSLSAAVCKSVDEILMETTLHVQKDGSIDAINWQSPIRELITAISFIQLNYNKCSYEESDLENHPLLLINWNKTPVRLFGGAYPLRTKDLCGFF